MSTQPKYGTPEETPEEKSFDWLNAIAVGFAGLGGLSALSAFVLWIIWSLVAGPIGVTGWILMAFAVVCGAVSTFAVAAKSDRDRESKDKIKETLLQTVREKNDMYYKLQNARDKNAEYERTIRTLRSQRSISVGHRDPMSAPDDF